MNGQVRRRASFRIDAHQLVGERLRVDGHLSRTGIQVYSDGAGGSRREYRPPEEVFADSALSSLRGIPVTIHHPGSGMVRADNWRGLAVGHVGDDVVAAADGQHVKASIWIHEQGAIQQVRDRKLSELSVGYWARLDETPGTTPAGETYDAIQRGIEGNHLALLEDGQARGGPTVRLLLDSNGHAVMRSESPATAPDKPRKGGRMQITIKADGIEYAVEADSDAVAQALTKERAATDEKIDAITKERDELQAQLDTAAETVESLEAKLDEATDPAKIKARTEARAKLMADAKLVAKDAEFDDDSDGIDLMKAALLKRGDDITGKSDDYVNARFDTLAGVEAEMADSSADESRKARGPLPTDRTDSKPRQAGVSLDRGLERRE